MQIPIAYGKDDHINLKIEYPFYIHLKEKFIYNPKIKN